MSTTVQQGTRNIQMRPQSSNIQRRTPCTGTRGTGRDWFAGRTHCRDIAPPRTYCNEFSPSLHQHLLICASSSSQEGNRCTLTDQPLVGTCQWSTAARLRQPGPGDSDQRDLLGREGGLQQNMASSTASQLLQKRQMVDCAASSGIGCYSERIGPSTHSTHQRQFYHHMLRE